MDRDDFVNRSVNHQIAKFLHIAHWRQRDGLGPVQGGRGNRLVGADTQIADDVCIRLRHSLGKIGSHPLDGRGKPDEQDMFGVIASRLTILKITAQEPTVYDKEDSA